MVEQGKGKVNDHVAQGRGFVQQQAEKVVAAVASGKQAYEATAPIDPGPANPIGS